MIQSRFIYILIIFALSNSAFSAHISDDVEAGDGVNDIQLPLTKESAAELVRIESQSKVLSVDEQEHNGQMIFRVKVLLDGKIKVYLIDPLTAHPIH